MYNVEGQDIEKDAYFIIRSLQELADESLKAHLSGMVYVLVRRFLSSEGEQKIWEVMSRMSIVEKEFKKLYEQGENKGISKVRENIFKQLVEAIKEGETQSGINRLIKSGEFTEDEVKEAYRQAGEA
ncbi:hypothetical protein LC087_11670 [Bacillus carboniphilus]|uniref:Uncharacterized protein n=1 Tax=Bacillus carboniphilus TaxID=86663 RepID=A0ABY9JQ67_9BACI|nr:hypothetical protein [Bacillus carboniphilus]WLR41545.1 hypothetical protein LC087_11670 [Bacillus carboniphilus]